MNNTSRLATNINKVPRDDPAYWALEEVKKSLEGINTNVIKNTNTIIQLSGAPKPVVPVLPGFRDRIIPVDSGDHQNFVLPDAPNPPESIILQVNGQLLMLTVDATIYDFTLVGTLITLTNAIPTSSFNMCSWYRIA